MVEPVGEPESSDTHTQPGTLKNAQPKRSIEPAMHWVHSLANRCSCSRKPNTLQIINRVATTMLQISPQPRRNCDHPSRLKFTENCTAAPISQIGRIQTEMSIASFPSRKLCSSLSLMTLTTLRHQELFSKLGFILLQITVDTTIVHHNYAITYRCNKLRRVISNDESVPLSPRLNLRAELALCQSVESIRRLVQTINGRSTTKSKCQLHRRSPQDSMSILLLDAGNHSRYSLRRERTKLKSRP